MELTVDSMNSLLEHSQNGLTRWLYCPSANLLGALESRFRPPVWMFDFNRVINVMTFFTCKTDVVCGYIKQLFVARVMKVSFAGRQAEIFSSTPTPQSARLHSAESFGRRGFRQSRALLSLVYG